MLKKNRSDILKDLHRHRAHSVFMACCERYDVAPDLVLDGSRRTRAVHARRDFWFTMRERGWTFPEIGELTGHDHSAVVTGIQERKLQEACPPLPRGKKVDLRQFCYSHIAIGA